MEEKTNSISVEVTDFQTLGVKVAVRRALVNSVDGFITEQGFTRIGKKGAFFKSYTDPKGNVVFLTLNAVVSLKDPRELEANKCVTMAEEEIKLS